MNLNSEINLMKMYNNDSESICFYLYEMYHIIIIIIQNRKFIDSYQKHIKRIIKMIGNLIH